MKMIDITSDENKREIYKLFDSFNKKEDIYNYFGISHNSYGVKYVNAIALEINFDLNIYHKRRFPERFCLNCGKKLKKGQKKFCGHSCSASYNNATSAKVVNKKKKQVKSRVNKQNKCKVCGKIDCLHTGVCNHHSLNWFDNLIYFGFDKTKLGTDGVFNEYENVKKKISDEYKNGLSVSAIKEKYNYQGSTERLVHVMKNMGINLRCLSDALRKAISEKRCKLPEVMKQFNYGWHNTWDGYKVFYRSSYEYDLCKYFDDRKIHYEMENLVIEYFDTILNKKRYALPDFYIEKENKIIEVKSRVTFVKQNMIDKMKRYIELGYDVLLNYEHKMYTFDEMLKIDEYKYKI
jgi:superfamily II DNA helicase RecQ